MILFANPGTPDERAIMKPILLMLLFLCCAARAGEQQGSTDLSNASELVAEGSATVVNGSLSAVAASGTVLVQSIEAAGDASMIVLAGASGAVQATIRLSGRAAREASLVAGASVNVVATSTGALLVASGKVLAFIPNEIGKALIHHSRASDRG
ncbi:MAG: hypothetical protein JWP34_5320 [Massilia sp.]|nr:hypothetical protein [Massilia sp.]